MTIDASHIEVEEAASVSEARAAAMLRASISDGDPPRLPTYAVLRLADLPPSQRPSAHLRPRWPVQVAIGHEEVGDTQQLEARRTKPRDAGATPQVRRGTET